MGNSDDGFSRRASQACVPAFAAALRAWRSKARTEASYS